MNYEKKYKEALERASKLRVQNPFDTIGQMVEHIFPELKESGDERIRKSIIAIINNYVDNSNAFKPEMLAWLEKQSDKIVDCQQNHQDVNYPNGGIVMEDFSGGEGFYKLHLDYLNKKQIEEVEEMVRIWNKGTNASNENIINCIGMCLTDANEQRFKDYDTTLKDCLVWLEKQGESKPIFNADDWYVSKVDGKIYNAKFIEKQDEQKSIDSKKIDVLKFIRKETCCGFAEANEALLKLIKVLKEHPSHIMDKSRKLKIEWEEQK